MKPQSSICKFLLAMLLTLMSACASTNFDVEQNSSFAIRASENTRLGKLKNDRDEFQSAG